MPRRTETDAELRTRIANAYGRWGAFLSVVIESSGAALDECAAHVALERRVIDDGPTACVICNAEVRPTKLFRSERPVQPRPTGTSEVWFGAGAMVCLECEREGRISYDAAADGELE